MSATFIDNACTYYLSAYVRIQFQVSYKIFALFYEYQYLRDNIAGPMQELWYHEQGDRSWLVVTRNTVTHEISKVELAREVSRSRGRAK